VRGEPIVHVLDLASEVTHEPPEVQKLVEFGGFRTILALPLRKDAALLGIFVVGRREVRPFTERQIALLHNFAEQAVVAMENARLLGELRQRTDELEEALEQQTATAEVLGVINSSPGDLAPVFEAMLAKAMDLCEAAFGQLWIYDGDCFEMVASCGVPVEYAEYVSGRQHLSPGTAHGRLLAGERTVHAVDLAAEHLYQSGDRHRRATVDLAGARSLLGVALLQDEKFLGALMIYRQEVRPFTDKQIALLQNFAAQAVIAMENARLLTETREALEQQTATAEVLGVINSSPGDLGPVFEAMLENATRLCAAPYGALRLFDGERFHVAAIHGDPAFTERQRRHDGIGAALHDPIRHGERVVNLPDVRDSALYQRNPIVRERIDLGKVRSYLAVALRKEEVLVGVIIVYRQEVRPFSDREIALLGNFAAQAVIAIENARLITETREALEQQTATAEVLGVINSSPGDLGPVFDAILEKAHAVCGAALGGLLIYDEHEFRPIAIRAEPSFAEFWRQTPVQPPREGDAPYTQLIRGERIVHLPDVRASNAYRDVQVFRDFMDRGRIRTLLVVPLHKDAALLGAITVFRQDVRPFTDQQIGLLQNFAAQAVIAMENARLITETREALEQQTATAEVLGVINASPGDLAPVFDAMLEKAMRLCGAAYGDLLTYGNELFHVAAAVHDENEIAERHPFPPPPGGLLDAIVHGEQVVFAEDVRENDAYASPKFRELVDSGGYRSVLCVALRKDSGLVGALSIFRKEIGPFSGKQIALLQNFAAQAVIAMENARLITETREALEQQTATAEVLGVINSSPGDLVPVFDTIVEKAMRLCEAAHGHLWIYDGARVHPVAVRGDSRLVEWMNQRGVSPVLPASGTGPIGRILGGDRYVHITDVLTDASYRSLPQFRDMVDHGGIRTLLDVPLRKDGSVLGIIAVYRQDIRPFSDKQIALLENFAAQAVIAMENARLLGELRQRTDEVAELNRGLEARVAEQVDELGRVGRLKRFLAPQLAELIVSQGDEKILESHRREIVVVFCDLRGYTAFTETAEPEEVLEFLRQYHGALGPLVSQLEGTLDQFSGDGIMVFFNDPVPIPDPAERAVKMAVAMREAANTLIAGWRRHGCDLGFGAGIAQGFATLGQIGFSDRSGYTAIGTVCNLAARLCDEAKDGQILISSRIAEAVEAVARLEDLGSLDLKGLRRPVAAFNVGELLSSPTD
jgi:GAF domain-containing protein